MITGSEPLSALEASIYASLACKEIEGGKYSRDAEGLAEVWKEVFLSEALTRFKTEATPPLFGDLREAMKPPSGTCALIRGRDH